MTPTTPTAAPGVSVEVERLMQLAQDYADEAINHGLYAPVTYEARDRLREALGGSAVPVAWMKRTNIPGDDWDAYDFSANQYGDFQIPLYTAPPPPVGELQGVSEEELYEFKVRLTEYGLAMRNSEGARAKVLADVLVSTLQSFAASRPVAEPSLGKSSLTEFNELMGDTKESPIERLRFFCSLAMSAQDWLDVEPFLDALTPVVAAPIAAAPTMAGVGFQYLFVNPFGDEVWRDDASEWNGNRPKASREIFAIAPPPEGGIGEPS